jgi:hypothetical protein
VIVDDQNAGGGVATRPPGASVSTRNASPLARPSLCAGRSLTGPGLAR